MTTPESAARELAKALFDEEWIDLGENDIAIIAASLKQYGQEQCAEAQDMARIAHLWLRQAQFTPEKRDSVVKALKALDTYFENLTEAE